MKKWFIISSLILSSCKFDTSENNLPLLKIIFARMNTIVATNTSTTYTIGGTISGYTGSGLVLSDGTESLTVTTSATIFTFSAKRAGGYSYTVTVGTQPSTQTCTVTSGTGIVASSNVTSVSVACVSNASGVSGTVITFAGSGSIGSTDGTGISASFKYPQGLGIDSSGNIYVGDTQNNKIRKITSGGVVTTLAGSGAQGSADGTGTSATFYYPYQIAVDSSNDLYVTDAGNNKIRKVTSSGVVTTFAGSGSTGSADATGTAASFSYPLGVAIDSNGIIYVSDANNNKIRKITSSGVVTTFAGSGSAGATDATGASASFNSPHSIAIDLSGNLYVADMNNNKIRKITSSGVVTTLAGSGAQGSVDGTGTSATFYSPQGIAVDSNGNLYIGDLFNNKIRKITSSGVVTTLAGSGSQGSSDGLGTSASFYYPYNIVIDSNGFLYVADDGNHKIRKITP
ncbi:MAG: hypothetical protein IPO06_24045 [Leptospiraceae bacterium]|nr:hypothetical protein [Leptospiraceae bacterium]